MSVDLTSVVMITVKNCIMKRDSAIKIYDGFDESSALLFTIESDSIPDEPIVSTTNNIFIIFDINTFSESKFQLNWNEISQSVANISENATNTLNCTKNSEITVNHRVVISSPGFPNGYDSNLQCMWTFKPDVPGFHVYAHFTSIDLEATPECLADYVSISSSSDLVNFNQSKQLCSVSHLTYRNKFDGNPYLRIQFQADYSNNRTGFEAYVALSCGGALDAAQGVISSNMTLGSQNCEWFVNVKRGRTINFTIEAIDMEKASDGTCSSYLIIRNGPNEESPFLGSGKYCGTSQSIQLEKTSSNKAYVQYVQNNVLAGRSFSLKYRTVEHSCGGSILLSHTLTNEVTITTPNYPNIPNPHIECVWRIISTNGDLIKVEFLERFDLSTTPNCISEYLEVREGSTSVSPLVGRYCSKMPDPIFTDTNAVRLHYFTDVSVPRNGFKVRVSTARCGKSYTAAKGYVASSGYPGRGK